MTTPSDFYARAVAGTPPATMEGGASGYFSAASAGLDPSLFEGSTLRPEVRSWLTTTLYKALTKLGLKRPGEWAHIWLAGSGASYQWAADRGNGDLDVLFGVEYSSFLRCNEDWRGMPESQLADWVNQSLKTELWPRTAHQQIGDQTYEVTFYLNPSIGRNIETINPYAAYDVRGNKWTVTPLAHNDTAPERNWPSAWYNQVSTDAATTSRIVDTHNRLHESLAAMAPGSPQWHTTGAQIRQNADSARALFDEIHEGRHEAFTPGGHGYGDFHNFRWQSAKRSGAVGALKGIIDVAHRAQDAADTELYGGHIASANEAIQRAAFVNQARPGLR